GVIGAGHLGKIHIRLLKEITDFQLVGFVDSDDENAAKVTAEYGIKRYQSFDDLLTDVDAVDIVTPTFNHYESATRAMKMGKHVFIEKPLANNMQEAKDLLALSREAGIKVQVGHVERFNPAFLAAQQYDMKPMFIETHRLAEFNPRGTDVSVVLDLMIHDIDITLSVVKSNVKKISASGVAVVSDTPDIANARIEFDNGCVANITASRISLKNMRKTRLFQRDAYITVDFLKKKMEVFRLEEAHGQENPFSILLDLGKDKGKKIIHFESPEVEPVNSIKRELELFGQSIASNTPTAVPIEDGYNAMMVAYEIIEKINMMRV
ncbi:MAG TPA: Gfo/Idh/MocA family oxidoreductase, partial [Bacteroidia bacterium]|nr:Gfo/Idh/MocA family oxidoreductase [Bacteroidia bacterium]